jgi:hypothetical protein
MIRTVIPWYQYMEVAMAAEFEGASREPNDRNDLEEFKRKQAEELEAFEAKEGRELESFERKEAEELAAFEASERKFFEIKIDRTEFKVHEKSLTGKQLRELPQPPIGPDRDLFEVVHGGSDRKILDDEVVTMRDGLRFFTAPAQINPGRA